MSITTLRWLLLPFLLALFLPTAPASGQEVPAFPPELPDSVQEILAEAQQTQQRLAELQQQAMEGSPSLQERRENLQELVDSALREADPDFDRNVERMGELEAEAMSAQQSQDGERLQALMMEAQTLAGRLQAAQEEALERPGIREEMEGFEEELIEEMTRLDPQTPTLIARLQELGARLEAAGVG